MDDDSAELTFIGTATVLLRLGAFTILTDPNFLHRGQRAYLGRGLWTRRLTNPSMGPHQLPPLDAIVLSHLHGDHFDRVARHELTRDAPVITTPHAARRLERYHFTTVALGTWEHHTLQHDDQQLLITSTPGVHAYGMLGRLLPPVMGSMIEHRVAGEVRHRLHLSGDTLTGPHIDEIAERFPSIATAVVHLGGTRVLWHTVTMDAEQGSDFLHRLRPRVAVPVHYDDYRIFRSPLPDFLAATQRSNPEVRIRVVDRGDTWDLRQPRLG